MNLKQYIRHLLYDNTTYESPDIYQRFRIVCPEYSQHDIEVKPYPLPESEHMFGLIWDIHEPHTVSATIIPSDITFTYEKRFEPGIRTQMHSHEYLELFYIVDGEYRQKILGNEFTFHKGELCLIDRNCEHQEILDSGSSTILFLGVTNTIFNDIMKHLSTSGRIASFLNMALLEQKNLQQYLHFKPQPEGMKKMEQTLYLLLSELKQHDVASPIICQGLLLRIFGILGTNYEFSLSKQLRKQMNWILFEEITDYMENHLTQISITRLSEEFHFQEDYFNRLIKTQTGLTYTEYLQLLRLRRAESLLLTTNATIDQIAEAVGYHNKGYFYKNIYGTAPAYAGTVPQKDVTILFCVILQIPFPVSYFRQILTILVDVLFVLYEFVVHLLNQIRSSVAKLWQIFDHILY